MTEQRRLAAILTRGASDNLAGVGLRANVCRIWLNRAMMPRRNEC